MSQSYPVHLESLTPREAIADTLARALLAIDLHDAALFDSVWAGEDVVFEILDGDDKIMPNLTLIRSHIFDKAGLMDTTHSATNIRIDLKDGANTASLTATSMAQNAPPGRGKELDGPKFTVGGRYHCDFVMDKDGQWKLKKCSLNVVWRQGDATIMMPPKKE